MITFKPGATFSAIATITVVKDGVSVADLTGWTFRSQLRRKAGALVAELTCTLMDGPARKVRLAAASTAAWPEKTTVQADILCTDPAGNTHVPTGTFEFALGEMVTHD
jgi:hypothetical protein